MTMQGDFKLGDEAGRLSALHRYEILDTPPEEEFSDIIRLVQSIFDLPLVSINFIDTDRQWSKAAAGIPTEIPRAMSICDHTIRGRTALDLPDLTEHPTFAANPFVADGGVRCYLGVPLTSPDGYNIGALCVAGAEPREFSEAEADILRNFARLVMSQLELRQIARNDALTGALTRRAFRERLERSLNSDAEIGLVLIDIDHFKSINDRFGHPAGDVVLRCVAETLRTHSLPHECLGRIGGEEFGLLLPGRDASAVVARAEALRRQVVALEWPELNGIAVTISLGAAMRRGDETADQLMARADIALYAAKRSGRNRTVEAGTESEAPV
ncbi:sensor domain-containing diguanylate cyclase [Paracoccus laeviglucosivorans]|uniref:diguanylate cyclase n=1 Tax=Paracoccus laeviglucosivorans TaxID=1197861 RepID=A0A521BK03_9RHOB|nr:sensor domain-containing diguanylate cyclase [Paracoccus laeviglucosivorans]SMO47396.1 diguanylate cyclase with GAF sensor [Paracoccus laeviglucosivorans]